MSLEARFLCSAIRFDEPAYYPAAVGTQPVGAAEHVAVGDFNGDGVADLVVAGNHIGALAVQRPYVRVLPGRGDGTFAPAPNAVKVGTSLSNVAVGDFNRDGKLDAVLSDDSNQGFVHVLLGAGDGTLGPATSFRSGSRSGDIAVADFDGDSVLDLAVANAREWAPSGTRIRAMHAGGLLRGKGDGTFGREEFVDTGERPQHFVEAGDVNGDGRADLVFGQVVIGPGDFAAPQSRVFASIPLSENPARPPTVVAAAITGLELADLNGDGRLDTAVSAMRDFLGNSALAATLGGRGDGTFGAAKLHEAGIPIATDIVVADFNADGRPDLALTGEDPRFGRPTPVQAAIALENAGSFAFGKPQYFPLTVDDASPDASPGKLAAGFFNQDPLPDLAIALPASNAVGVLVNESQAIFASAMRLHSLPRSFIGRPLARFSVTGGTPAADAFRVTINWGDRSGRSEGTVIANDDGSFTVLGSHTYRQRRIYRVGVYIQWPDADAIRFVSFSVRPR